MRLPSFFPNLAAISSRMSAPSSPGSIILAAAAAGGLVGSLSLIYLIYRRSSKPTKSPHKFSRFPRHLFYF